MFIFANLKNSEKEEENNNNKNGLMSFSAICISVKSRAGLRNFTF